MLGAIFDMDGLLLDTERVYDICWKNYAENNNLPFDYKMITEIRGTNGQVMANVLKRYWPDRELEQIIPSIFKESQKILSEHVPIKEGVVELLEFFKHNNYKIAVASSSPLNIIEENLINANLIEYFDAIVSGEQVKHGKPAPDIFLLAANRLKVKPERCYVFEDAVHGAIAGCRAGCKTYMILDLVQPTDEVSRMVDGIYPSLINFKNEILK